MLFYLNKREVCIQMWVWGSIYRVHRAVPGASNDMLSKYDHNLCNSLIDWFMYYVYWLGCVCVCVCRRTCVCMCIMWFILFHKCKMFDFCPPVNFIFHIYSFLPDASIQCFECSLFASDGSPIFDIMSHASSWFIIIIINLLKNAFMHLINVRVSKFCKCIAALARLLISTTYLDIRYVKCL